MWKKPSMTPPSERPCLFLRKSDLAPLRKRLQHADMGSMWDRMKAFAPLREEDWLQLSMRSTLDIIYAIESYALQYVVLEERSIGLKAKKLALIASRRAFNPNLQDISREIGRLMIAIALVYDWCNALLDEEEKKRLVVELKRLASLLECGYPPTHEGAFVGHTSEWMLMRDMMAAGIAIYEDDPEMYDYAAGRFLEEFVPARNFFYPSGWHHQGDNYGSYRYQAELFATWIFGRMGHARVFDPRQERVGYQWIYARRPDGKLLRDGDADNPLYAEKEYIKLFPLVYLMAGNYYGNGYFLEQQQIEHPVIPDMYLLFAILFHNPELGTKPISELPLTRYFAEPAGIMIARTGWNEGAVIDKQSSAALVEMKIGMYQYNNHQHLDAGAFQIYYKGYLAIDSGIYKGSSGKYQSPHNKYYFKRTVAHNAMLVHDPGELQEQPYIVDGKLTWPNVMDGGQRWPGAGKPPQNMEDLLGGEYERGEVLAHSFGPDPQEPDYSYLKGDLTKAYSKKVRHYTRSFVCLNLKQAGVPAVLIVFDAVEAASKHFEKAWLLHSIEKPEISGKRTVIARTEDGYGGELAVDTLLPKEAAIEPVGGEGRQFESRGVHYANDFAATVEQGAWRIEVRPKEAAERDLFLHAIQIKDHDGEQAAEAKLVEAGDAVGVQVQGWLVLFSRSGLLLDGQLTIAADESGNRRKILVTDIANGIWLVHSRSADGKQRSEQVEVTEGVLLTETAAGVVQLERMGADGEAR